MLEFKLLWREIFGVLHIVVDEVAICRVPLYDNNVSHDETKFIYCLGCMENILMLDYNSKQYGKTNRRK